MLGQQLPPWISVCVTRSAWQEFIPTGVSIAQNRYGNVYYHVNIPCILTRCPFFFRNAPTIAMQLLPVHTEFLSESMNHH